MSGTLTYCPACAINSFSYKGQILLLRHRASRCCSQAPVQVPGKTSKKEIRLDVRMSPELKLTGSSPELMGSGLSVDFILDLQIPC